ncbi:MAG: OmpH family outer membrane protein [Paracoccus sp. (in: a-proteobacteria)]|uniref:OmpH family outer membrane protein n=1 Tax=Paracoccus sp. TaxID=267 RepID=UPI0026DFD2C1|nr:OmpH family outer membrane protein [Paracoccus sp. (in: a-proteobacteria)]MDO5614315.1 OmpH family outer membrane protein [Paracoccus sp. (in: a-proteobacteria)]
MLAVWVAPAAAQQASPVAPPPVNPLRNADPTALPSGTVPAVDGAVLAIAPVLTVDEDALFLRSAWGQRVQAEVEEQGRLLQAENDRLAEQLAAEEADLTARRSTTDAAEFRRLAEAFDARATEVRRERAQVAADLNARAETDRAAFYRAALPVMGRMMQERGAVAVLDQRTVFVSLDVIDITADLVLRLDQQLGDGAGMATQDAGDPPPPEAADPAAPPQD